MQKLIISRVVKKAPSLEGALAGYQLPWQAVSYAHLDQAAERVVWEWIISKVATCFGRIFVSDVHDIFRFRTRD